MYVFISYNVADKAVARSIGAQLKVTGADVWFDEWEIKAGDSIPGKLDAGLGAIDIFVLIWSEHAKRSRWVRKELHSAISRSLENDSIRIIPIRLDSANLPNLISDLRYVDLSDRKDTLRAILEILGLATKRELLIAIQNGLEELVLPYRYFYGYGIAVACPQCGADIDSLESLHFTDYARYDEYVGVQCRECGWHTESEI